MAGTANSGNRGGNRGRPIQRRYTLSAPVAILLRELTRSATGEQQPTQKQLTAVLESAIAAAADRRLLEIE